jgi:hypothetical protein
MTTLKNKLGNKLDLLTAAFYGPKRAKNRVFQPKKMKACVVLFRAGTTLR